MDMSKLHQAPQARGMTMMEVMIAVACLAIALSGTISVWANAERLNAISREESIAQAAIQKVMNDIRSTSFDNIPGAFAGGSTGAGSDRLSPGRFFVNLAGDPVEKLTDSEMQREVARWTAAGSRRQSMGVKVTKYPTTEDMGKGPMKLGDYWWVPDANEPEMRVIFINDEDPIEVEMGEDGTHPEDGFDLNSDGTITNARFSAGTPILTFTMINDVGAQRLFPRKLTYGSAEPITAGYRNITALSVLPVIIQVRWWSLAGVPREISAITFITNR